MGNTASPWRPLPKLILLAVLFLGVILGTGWMMFSFEPFRDVDQLGPKWAHWKEHKDDYDVLFIGSSRTAHGLIPALFDEGTAAAGMPTRSFNFGADAMLAPEDAYVVDNLLREPPSLLKWVFLEVAVFADDFDGRDPETARSRHWHDWTRTWLCVRSALWPRQRGTKWKKWFEADPGKQTPLSLSATHLRLFAMRGANIGRGAAIVEDLLEPEGPAAKLNPKLQGFSAYPDAQVMKGAEREAYVEQLDHYRRNPARFSRVKDYHLESVVSVVDAVRATGAKPVLFVAPSLGPLRFQMPDLDDLTVLDFSGIADYPDLFEPDVRVDIAHLSKTGAERFTRHLTTKFVESVGDAANAQPADSTSAPE